MEFFLQTYVNFFPSNSFSGGNEGFYWKGENQCFYIGVCSMRKALLTIATQFIINWLFSGASLGAVVVPSHLSLVMYHSVETWTGMTISGRLLIRKLFLLFLRLPCWKFFLYFRSFPISDTHTSLKREQLDGKILPSYCNNFEQFSITLTHNTRVGHIVSQRRQSHMSDLFWLTGGSMFTQTAETYNCSAQNAPNSSSSSPPPLGTCAKSISTTTLNKSGCANTKWCFDY